MEVNMANYIVTFTKYMEYCVNAEDENEAEDKAYELFCRDAKYPVADTHYDEVYVGEIDETDEDK